MPLCRAHAVLGMLGTLALGNCSASICSVFRRTLTWGPPSPEPDLPTSTGITLVGAWSFFMHLLLRLCCLPCIPPPPIHASASSTHTGEYPHRSSYSRCSPFPWLNRDCRTKGSPAHNSHSPYFIVTAPAVHKSLGMPDLEFKTLNLSRQNIYYSEVL